MKTFFTILLSVMALLLVTPTDATASPDSAHRIMAPDYITPKPSWTARPCVTEDSVNCYWDASIRGNGSGHSFIVRAVPGRAHIVCVFYVERTYARSHDYCS